MHSSQSSSRVGRRWLWTVVLIAAAGVALTVGPVRTWIGSRHAAARPELAGFVAAYGDRRIFEPRLTGGFAYAELRVSDATRSGAVSADSAPLEARSAAIALQLAARNSSNPLTVGASGTAQLLTGEVERAVTTLEAAVNLAPRDSRLLSDLAAAYLVRSNETGRVDDAARAIGSAQQAAVNAPSLLEARFNLALSLEKLSLRAEAIQAWRKYLEVDAVSPWATEAARHVDALTETPEARWDRQRQEVIAAARAGDVAIQTVTTRLPDTAYEYTEHELLPAWAEAWLSHDLTKARDVAVTIRRFGEALVRAVDEHLALDTAQAIERATAAGSSTADALARGQRQFRAARGLYEEDKVAESAKAFAIAQPDLMQGNSPFVGWATLYLAIADYNRTEFDRAAAQLDALIARAAERRHLTLLGRAERVRGLIHFVKGDVANSLDYYLRALGHFERARARQDLAAIHSIIAENLDAVGDVTNAWIHRGQAFDGLPVAYTPRRRQVILLSGANMAKRRNLLPTALAIQNELLQDALTTAHAIALFEGFLGRATLYQGQGQEELAILDLDAAQRALADVSDPNLTKRSQAEANLVRGEVLQQSDPKHALAALAASQAYFAESGQAQRLARLHLATARALVASGRPAQAESSLREGILVLEQQRARLANGQLSLQYFNLPWNLFDEMIALKTAAPATALEALSFAERARARSLLDAASGSERTAVTDPASLAARLAPDTTVIYYASLDQQLLAWIIRTQGVVSFQLPVPAADLVRQVTDVHSALQSGRAQDFNLASERLFDAVVRPLATAVAPNARLIVVPDGALHVVPFAALRDRLTGRFLIEDHPITLAPSATMLERASARLNQLAELQRGPILVVANPTLTPTDIDRLPPLRGAEAEAQDIRALYHNAVVLTGAAATKRTFVEKMAGFPVVHFGGHAVANQQYPHLSRLLLAPDPPLGSGTLFAHEIALLQMNKTGLVVLAACNTGRGTIAKGEGPISLARPFLAIGVPAVIATLWDVKDSATRIVFDKFYRSLQAGDEPGFALRSAQLAMLRHPDAALRTPGAWAGFVALGGVRAKGGL